MHSLRAPFLIGCAGALCALYLQGQSLPAGDYAFVRLVCNSGGPSMNLQRTDLLVIDWTGQGDDVFHTTITAASQAPLVGQQADVLADGNPFFHARNPLQSGPGSVTVGFTNADASLLLTHAVIFPWQQANAMTTMRFGMGLRKATALSVPDLVGRYHQITWEISIAVDTHQVWGQNYSIAELNLQADQTGVRTVLDASTGDDQGGNFTWDVDGGDLLVPEPGLRLPVAASKDFAMLAGVEVGGHTMWLQQEFFIRLDDTLVAADLVGVWGMQFVGINLQQTWQDAELDRGMVVLRPDQTGSFYLLATAMPRWIDRLDDVRMDFTWRLQDGKLLVVTDEGEEAFVVSAGKQLIFGFQPEAGEGVQDYNLNVFLKLDLNELPKPVRHIPLYSPVRDGWGEMGFAGWLYTGAWPWIYSQSIGWLYATEGDGMRLWVHDPALGWLLTDPLMFPYFFGPEPGAVYYLDTRADFTPETRRLFAYHLQRWIH